VVILDAKGKAAYNRAGEVSQGDIAKLLDRMLEEAAP